MNYRECDEIRTAILERDAAIESLQQQLKQARREGWEQSKMEIEYYLKNEERSAALLQQIAYIRYIADAIAAMEYGGEK